jgi:hypothetical protein
MHGHEHEGKAWFFSTTAKYGKVEENAADGGSIFKKSN